MALTSKVGAKIKVNLQATGRESSRTGTRLGMSERATAGTMDRGAQNMDGVLGLVGVVIGFLLGWVKDWEDKRR